MGMPPHIKCCGCCCSLNVGVMIGSGLYIAFLLIFSFVLPFTGTQEDIEHAKAFCAGTNTAYRTGNEFGSALAPIDHQHHSAHLAPALPLCAQATPCAMAPTSALAPTGTTWSRRRKRLTRIAISWTLWRFCSRSAPWSSSAPRTPPSARCGRCLRCFRWSGSLARLSKPRSRHRRKRSGSRGSRCVVLSRLPALHPYLTFSPSPRPVLRNGRQRQGVQ